MSNRAGESANGPKGEERTLAFHQKAQRATGTRRPGASLRYPCCGRRVAYHATHGKLHQRRCQCRRLTACRSLAYLRGELSIEDVRNIPQAMAKTAMDLRRLEDT